jgi:hypothetical protein
MSVLVALTVSVIISRLILYVGTVVANAVVIGINKVASTPFTLP